MNPAIPQPLRRPTALSRADLAWALGLQGEHGLAVMAELAGFEEVVREPERPRQARPTKATKPPVEPTPAPEKYLPVPFWRLEKTIDLEIEASPVEMNLRPLEPGDIGPLSELRQLAPTALAPWPRVHRVLFKALRTTRDGKRVDLPLLIDRWSRAELIQRLPRKRQSAWSPRITLLLDRNHRLAPVREGQTELALRLLRIRGEAALSVYVRLADFPDEWVNTHTWERREVPNVSPGEPVMALTDLGLADAGGEDRAFWEELGRKLRNAGARPWALVPLPRQRWLREAQSEWERVEWLQPCSSGTSGKRALLVLLALAVRVEPGLLREMRRLLGPRADAGTEIDVWAQLVDPSPSSVAAQLTRELLGELRSEWTRLPEDERAASLRALKRWHGSLAREIWYEEVLSAQALCALPPGFEDDAAEARRFAMRLGVTHRATGPVHGELLESSKAWVMRFSERVPRQFWSDPELGPALGPVVAKALKESGATTLPPGFSLRWGAGEGPPARWVAWQVGEKLHFRPEGQQGAPAERGAPLATFLASSPEVAVAEGGDRPARMELTPSGATRPLPAGSFVLHTDRQELHFARYEREPWANAGAGRDKYGLWAAFEVEGVEHRFRWIPPGRFWMGSPESEQGRWNDEGPRHLVTLTEGFWLGEAPVTQTLWEKVMGENPSKFASPESADHPVEQVSWDECKKFLVELAKKAPALGARLPWEAEWEYACRAGTETSTYAGELEIQDNKAAPLDSIAWYWGNRAGKTQPVKSKLANPWGLYDMLGNVWEWCGDGRRNYAAEPLTNPFSTAEMGSYRVIRGGSWGDSARDVRAAARDWISPGFRLVSLGFRLARGQGAQLVGGAPEPAGHPRGREAAASGEGRASADARRPRGPGEGKGGA